MRNALQVAPIQRKLILGIQETGPVAQFPKGAVHSRFGQNNARPLVVVHNPTNKGSELQPGIWERPDGSWQGADSNGAVVIHEIDPRSELLQLVDIQDSRTYSPPSLAAILEIAAELGHKWQTTMAKSRIEGQYECAGPCKNGYGGLMVQWWQLSTIVRRGQLLIKRGAKGEESLMEPQTLFTHYLTRDGDPIVWDDIPLAT